MNNEMPKNIRQIGNVSDSTKVYLEDYVDTYIKQLKAREDDEPISVFFLGEIKKVNSEEIHLVSGALLMKGVKKEKGGMVLGKETWKIACEESKKYFEGLSIIGWGMVSDMSQGGLSPQVHKTHERLFQKRKSLFVKIDKNDDHETIYTYRFNGLMEIQGNYIYYEKNPNMQEYMIANRKENHLPPSEAYEDRAAQNFRSVIQQKQVKHSPTKRRELGIVASLVGVAALAVVVHSRYEALQELGRTVLNIEQEDSLEASSEVQSSEGKVESFNVIADQLESPLEADVLIEEFSNQLDESDEIVVDKQSQNIVSEGGATELLDTSTVVQESEQTSSGAVRYIVEEGDTLGLICTRHYGSLQKLEDVYKYNDLTEDEFIYIGQVILLP